MKPIRQDFTVWGMSLVFDKRRVRIVFSDGPTYMIQFKVCTHSKGYVAFQGVYPNMYRECECKFDIPYRSLNAAKLKASVSDVSLAKQLNSYLVSSLHALHAPDVYSLPYFNRLSLLSSLLSMGLQPKK